MAAGVVDLAVVFVVGAVLSIVAGGEFTLLLGVVTVGWALFYYFVSESTAGQTLGKRWLGLRVERAAGGTPDEREIALRTVLRLVDGIGFYVVGLVVMLRTGERRQRLGDIVAGTAIVDAREPCRAHRQVHPQDDGRPGGLSRGSRRCRRADEEQPHRAEVPSNLFDLDRDEETESGFEPDDGPRVEIVSHGRPGPRRAEVAPEPELPVAEVEIDEPEAELPLPEPEAELPAARARRSRSLWPRTEPVADAETETETDSDEDSRPATRCPACRPRLWTSSPTTWPRPPRSRAAGARKEAEPVAAEESEAKTDKPDADEPITVKPVETVSPMDLVMADAEGEPEKAGNGPGPALARAAAPPERARTGQAAPIIVGPLPSGRAGHTRRTRPRWCSHERDRHY